MGDSEMIPSDREDIQHQRYLQGLYNSHSPISLFVFSSLIFEFRSSTFEKPVKLPERSFQKKRGSYEFQCAGESAQLFWIFRQRNNKFPCNDFARCYSVEFSCCVLKCVCASCEVCFVHYCDFCSFTSDLLISFILLQHF